MDKFDVGQYVWYIDPERPIVKHYLVVEEIVKKSVSGQTREYVFEAISPSGKKGKVLKKNLKGNFFNDRKQVYDFMLEQAAVAINKMLDNAERKQQEPSPVSEQKLPEGFEENSDDAIVELPDGTKARLKGGFPK